jgi:hypothetical protein
LTWQHEAAVDEAAQVTGHPTCGVRSIGEPWSRLGLHGAQRTARATPINQKS